MDVGAGRGSGVDVDEAELLTWPGVQSPSCCAADISPDMVAVLGSQEHGPTSMAAQSSNLGARLEVTLSLK